METTIATTLSPDELAALDRLRRGQGVTREEALREAVRWYDRWGDVLPSEDPTDDEIEL